MARLHTLRFPFGILTNDGNHSVAEKRMQLRRCAFVFQQNEITSCANGLVELAAARRRRGKRFFIAGDLGKPNVAAQAGLRYTRSLAELSRCDGVIIGETHYNWEPDVIRGGNGMKRFACGMLFALLLVSPVSAGLIAYEGFDYAAGAGLSGLNGGTGWKDAWFGAKGKAGAAIADLGQTFPKLAVSGLKSVLDGSDIRIFRYLDTSRPEVAGLVEDGPAGKTFGKDGTTIWISFLIACSSFPTTVSHGGIHLMDGVEVGPDYKKTQRIQLGRQNMVKTWYLGRVDRGGPAKGTWAGTVVADATVRLLVYRFDFKVGPEEGWLWVDPEPGKVPDPAKADIHAEKISDFRFNAVNLGSGGGAAYIFDELRLGTTFADVAPAK